jgi:hypothetical protein
LENISAVEQGIIRKLHLRGRGIVVIAHVPQQNGGCHPFEFLRGVLLEETYEQAFKRTREDILQHIADKCGRACECNGEKPVIQYRIFGQ